MSKKLTLNGLAVYVEDADAVESLRNMLKDGVQVEDLGSLTAQINYDEKTFIQKADEYFRLHDYIQSHEELWAAANYFLKKFFLIMGVKLASRNAKKHAISTMEKEAIKLKLEFDEAYSMAGMLKVGWNETQRCHASFNELTSTTPEEWDKKCTDIKSFVTALSDLKSNDLFKTAVLRSIEDVPTNLKYEKFTHTVKEQYGDDNYDIYCKIF